jgi:hypothetical protein
LRLGVLGRDTSALWLDVHEYDERPVQLPDVRQHLHDVGRKRDPYVQRGRVRLRVRYGVHVVRERLLGHADGRESLRLGLHDVHDDRHQRQPELLDRDVHLSVPIRVHAVRERLLGHADGRESLRRDVRGVHRW